MSSTTVAAEFGLMLIVPEHGEVPLTARLNYSGDDPYALRMEFHVGATEPVEWIFARDLLAEGMVTRAGEGDVQVWPGTGSGRKVLNIALSSPFGQAHFEAPTPAVSEFLLRTFEIVPVGREGGFIDLEGELDELLRWA